MKKLFSLLLMLGIFASTASASPKTIFIRHRDPGCHWYVVNGHYLSQYRANSSVILFNQDIATQKIVGSHGTIMLQPGQKILLGKGVYHETMMGQASDDNHLLLTIH